jgi:hypothetical protein
MFKQEEDVAQQQKRSQQVFFSYYGPVCIEFILSLWKIAYANK